MDEAAVEATGRRKVVVSLPGLLGQQRRAGDPDTGIVVREGRPC